MTDEIPEDLFKDVTFYIVGDISENVRNTRINAMTMCKVGSYRRFSQ